MGVDVAWSRDIKCRGGVSSGIGVPLTVAQSHKHPNLGHFKNYIMVGAVSSLVPPVRPFNLKEVLYVLLLFFNHFVELYIYILVDVNLLRMRITRK